MRLIWLLAITAGGLCAQCVPCHRGPAERQSHTGMAKALVKAEQSEILRANTSLEFAEGIYKTRIAENTLSVTDGNQTIRAPLQWAFGRGSAGQTYVFQHEGRTMESRVSYYEDIKGLDLTMGAQLAKPASLLEAAGRVMDRNDIRDCFGCHSSGGASGSPGVTCEACHGNAAQHLQVQQPMRALKKISAEEMNDLCGTCHRTWAQVVEMKLRGPLNVRFQPYRITNSKCFDAEDRRIACTACHDPHGELVKIPGAYDSKCQACHSGTKSAKNQKVCRTGKANCVTCHMPKVELAGSHFRFADHQIRVARPGDPYPN